MFPRSALVTGGASGIGRAVVELLERQGTSVRSLDLVDGFDVADPAAWAGVEAAELACLNAGTGVGPFDIAELADDDYRRVVGTNIDGVVFGVRRLAQVMEPGAAIVVTASLAGLVPMPRDPVYTLTKHALVGFVRSVAPRLAERGIRISAVAPGYVDTPLLDAEARAAFAAEGFPLLGAEDVAKAVLAAARHASSGECWVVQPAREPVRFRFPNVPGPGSGEQPPL